MIHIADKLSRLPAASLVASALMSCGAAGCATGIFGDRDSQACAETSLRNHPSDRLSIDAVPVFVRECSANDGGACSAVGIAYELGIGRARDARSAWSFYGRACDLGNARGCVNLGALLAGGEVGKRDLPAATALFQAACQAGERSGCARLGRLYRDGIGVEADPIYARTLVEQACASGETTACLDLADMLATSAPERALPLYVRSCLAGHAVACTRLNDERGPKAQGARASVVAAR